MIPYLSASSALSQKSLVASCLTCSGSLSQYPPRSSKSVNMETENYAIKNGDFKKDKELNKLELNGYLNQMIIASLIGKT